MKQARVHIKRGLAGNLEAPVPRSNPRRRYGPPQPPLQPFSICRTFMAKYREGGLGMREADISVPAVAADFEFLTSDRVEQDVMPGVAAGAIEFSVTYGTCHAVCS